MLPCLDREQRRRRRYTPREHDDLGVVDVSDERQSLPEPPREFGHRFPGDRIPFPGGTGHPQSGHRRGIDDVTPEHRRPRGLAGEELDGRGGEGGTTAVALPATVPAARARTPIRYHSKMP